jgi:hypothetical protein
LLSLNIYAFAGGVFLLFYGLGSIGFGYLIVRSGYIPAVLGFLLLIGGVGFVLRNFALVLIPSISTTFLQLPTIIAILVLGLWLVARARTLPAQWRGSGCCWSSRYSALIQRERPVASAKSHG